MVVGGATYKFERASSRSFRVLQSPLNASVNQTTLLDALFSPSPHGARFNLLGLIVFPSPPPCLDDPSSRLSFQGETSSRVYHRNNDDDIGR